MQINQSRATFLCGPISSGGSIPVLITTEPGTKQLDMSSITQSLPKLLKLSSLKLVKLLRLACFCRNPNKDSGLNLSITSISCFLTILMSFLYDHALDSKIYKYIKSFHFICFSKYNFCSHVRVILKDSASKDLLLHL
jgi:hypothetical protein